LSLASKKSLKSEGTIRHCQYCRTMVRIQPLHNKSHEGAGLFSSLTHEQKLKLIVNDDVQWAKLRASLRRVTTSLAMREIMPDLVDERIDEMERFAAALNGNIGLIQTVESDLSVPGMIISKGGDTLFERTSALFGVVGRRLTSPKPNHGSKNISKTSSRFTTPKNVRQQSFILQREMAHHSFSFR